jgi:hypothetical protein
MPAWADNLGFDVAAPRQNEDSLTCLLHHEQLNAEAHCTFTRIVLRLESMQAVQRFSQWRLTFDPLTQHLALHTLRVLRGEEITEHADPAKVRLVPHEDEAGAFVLHGHYTLLTLFEDVRPGDCLEVAYTLNHRPLLLAEHCHRLLFLPGNYAIDRYEWSVLHQPARGLRYLSAPTLGAPEISEDGHGHAAGLVRWTWRGSLRDRPPAEEQTPPWLLSEPWLQLSDLSDWSIVARSLAAAWPTDSEGAALTTEVRRIEAEGTTLVNRVELALRLVQDHCRYLCAPLELDGQMPSAPGEVLRRRYGDCKDLSLLLCCLLGRLGVAARLVLVHSRLGPRLPELLPAPEVFDHVAVEFTLEGETRWVDATARAQGGGPLGRALPPFGFGLPVDATTSTLCVPPDPSAPLDEIREIHETVLLDTRGGASMLRFRQRLTGCHADALRRELECTGAKEYQLARTAFFTARYGWAESETPLNVEDDRERNVLRTIEVYRVRGFVDLTRGEGRCAVTLPPSFALLALPRPPAGERRAPWFIACPLKIEHTMEVMSISLPAQPHQGQTVADNAITLIFRRKLGLGRWFQTVSLTTNLSSLPAEELKNHARMLDAANAQCAWGIKTNAGLARPHRRHNFLELLPAPPPSGHSAEKRPRPAPAPSRPATVAANPLTALAPVPAPKAAATPASLKHRSIQVRAGKRRHPISPWIWLLIAFLIASGTAVYFLKFHAPKADTERPVAPGMGERP